VRKLLISLLICAPGCGVGAGGPFVPVPIPAPIILPVPVTLFGAGIVPLDGQWVLADVFGDRSCLVIQESRVSILNQTCSSDQSGFAARIIEAPVISRTGNTIILTLTYNPKTADPAKSKLTFVGQLQTDLTFVGVRTDEVIDGEDGPFSRGATFARQ
jgi:hypothetical protein